tara:strand:+ start:65 stop:412 length:348 start_codon:yes stop_codon:yes gene_type:complete
MPTNKIIKNDTLFFKRDNQRGGILFDKVTHPLQNLFSKESISNIKKSNKKNKMIRASESKNFDKVRMQKHSNKKGGYMTNLFFPAGYSAAASTLGLYTLNHASGKTKKKKTSRKR